MNLNKLIQTVCDASTLTDPDALAKEVLSRIDKKDERNALEQALLIVVRKFVSRDHRPLITPGGQTGSGAHSSSAAGGSKPRSWKTGASVRSAWQRQLAARVNVGPKSFKWFGDCTVADLDFMEAHRRELAAAILLSADNVATIRALLVKHGVTTVREIPEGDVELRAAA